MSPGHDHWESSKESQFPSLFQTHHQDYTADITFWLDLARKQGTPILELGCGSGRVLLQLAEIGYTCFGIDNHPGMLAHLKKTDLSRLAGQVNLIVADMTRFNFHVHFPLIILPCNTFSTLTHSDRITALNCVHQHLLPGGLFAASVPNPVTLNALSSTDQPEIDMFFPHPETKNPVQVSYDIVKESERVAIHWYYDHLYPDGNVERLSFETNHSLATMDQYLCEYQGVGFEIHAIYGDFDYSPIRSDSPNLIIVALKIKH